jgi:hypothetical protein
MMCLILQSKILKIHLREENNILWINNNQCIKLVIVPLQVLSETFLILRRNAIDAVEKATSINYSECVFSLRYPAWNAHAPYCHLWPAPLYNIFPYYLINGTIFGGESLNTKCVFWLPLQVLPEIFLILRRNERDMIKNVYLSSRKVPVIVIF